MLEKGGLKHIMPEKHLVCKGPSAVVGIHFLFLQIQQLVIIVSDTNCFTPPPGKFIYSYFIDMTNINNTSM